MGQPAAKKGDQIAALDKHIVMVPAGQVIAAETVMIG